MATIPAALTLTAVLSASDPTATLSAAALAVQAISQQVAKIQFNQYGGFPGSAAMSAASQVMEAAARQWGPTKAAILSSAQLVVQGGGATAQINSNARLPGATAQSIASDIKQFCDGPLAEMIAAFSAAQTSCDQFDTGMTNAYNSSVNASAEAQSALSQAQLNLKYAENQLEADEKAARSAGSIILGIISFGGYSIYQMEQLQSEIRGLNQQAGQLNQEEQAYAFSLGSFQNAVNATKQASYALDTVTTALQQLSNSLKDIIAQNNPVLVIMQAYANAFATEFAGAVAQAKNFANA